MTTTPKMPADTFQIWTLWDGEWMLLEQDAITSLEGLKVAIWDFISDKPIRIEHITRDVETGTPESVRNITADIMESLAEGYVSRNHIPVEVNEDGHPCHDLGGLSGTVLERPIIEHFAGLA